MIYKTKIGTEGGSSGGFHYSGTKPESIRWITALYRGDTNRRLQGSYPNYTYTSIECDDTYGTEGSDDIDKLTVTTHPTPRTKAAWIEFLNFHGSHPDNG